MHFISGCVVALVFCCTILKFHVLIQINKPTFLSYCGRGKNKGGKDKERKDQVCDEERFLFRLNAFKDY